MSGTDNLTGTTQPPRTPAPAQAERASAAAARRVVSVARRVFIVPSRVSGNTREMLHNIR